MVDRRIVAQCSSAKRKT